MATQTTSINSSGTLYVAGGIDEVMISTGSVLFNGTSSYLSVPTNTIFDFTSVTNFTIEAWIYITGAPAGSTQLTIVGTRGSSSTTGWEFRVSTSRTLQFYYTANAGSNTNSPDVLALNTWYHVALVRNSGSASIFINGTVSVTNNSITNGTTNSNPLLIGVEVGSDLTSLFQGYISNLRMVNGTALYTGNFSPITAPLTPVYNTVFLLNKIYGQSATNNIIDSSVYRSVITNVGSAVPTNVNPFYTGEVGSLRFNGGSQYLTIPANSAFNFGTGDVTMECWVYPITYVSGAATASETIDLWSNAFGSYIIGQCQLQINSAGTVAFYYTTTVSANSGITSTAVIPLSAWTHLAVVRTGTTLSLYINGILAAGGAASISAGQALGTTGTGSIGRQTGTGSFPYYFTGYISNVRIVKGVALYTSNFAVPTQPLSTGVYTTQTSLLLTTPFASSSTAFKDSSINNFTVTNNDGTTATTLTPFISNLSNAPTLLSTVERISATGVQSAGEIDEITLALGSMVFNGSTRYVSLPFNTINPGSQDFTIEGWVYPLAATAGGFFAGQADLSTAGGSSIVCYVNSAATCDLYQGPGGVAITTPTCPVGQWSHVAYVRYGATGGTWRSYLNGVLVGSAAITGAINAGSAVYPPTIGGLATSNFFNGYISNHRIVVGTAVYTSSTFTPPTLPLTSIVNTRSLFSSPNSSQVVQDFSTASNTTTNVGGVTGTGLNPFSTVGSVQFNGSSQYLTAPSSSTAWTFGTGAFTVEFWMYPTVLSLASGVVVSNWVAASGSYVTGQWEITCNNSASGQLSFNWAITASSISQITSGASLPTLNAWNHVAVVRSGTTITIYLNGVSVGSGTMSTSLGATGTLAIGYQQVNTAQYYTGYLSNVRVVNGLAVYTAAFTPPTAPLTVIGTQTSLLLSTPFGTQATKDFSPNNFTITNTGIATYSIINPFIGNLGNPASRTSTVQRVSGQGLQVIGSFDEFSMNRGSISFNGSSNLLTVPTNTGFVFGTGDFTVEGWYYFNSISLENGLILLGTGAVGGSNFSAWYLRYNPTSYGNAVLGFYRYDGTETLNNFSFPTSNYLVTNIWYHIACSRQGTNLRMFLNGVQVGTTITSSLNFASVNSDPLQIGKVITGGGTFYLNGYASNIRVIKGVAVYNTNTNFTPPTQPFSTVDVYSTQTSLLLNTVAYPPLNKVDNSPNNFTITPTGSPPPSELNPFQ